MGGQKSVKNSASPPGVGPMGGWNCPPIVDFTVPPLFPFSPHNGGKMPSLQLPSAENLPPFVGPLENSEE